MAITSAICNSFKEEILQGGHCLNASGSTAAGNTIKCALYSSDSAVLSKSTTVYAAPADATADPTSTYEVTTTSSGYTGGGATGVTDTTSGSIYLAPTPDANYIFRIYYNKIPAQLASGQTTTYISQSFPQGLLHAALVEAYGFLKGPMDMLTLYENKYKQELTKFAAMQIGRRRRDDYTDGTVRIPIESPPQ